MQTHMDSLQEHEPAAKREPGDCTFPGRARGALQPQGLSRRMLEEVRLSSCMCRAVQRLPEGLESTNSLIKQQKGVSVGTPGPHSMIQQ